MHLFVVITDAHGRIPVMSYNSQGWIALKSYSLSASADLVCHSLLFTFVLVKSKTTQVVRRDVSQGQKGVRRSGFSPQGPKWGTLGWLNEKKWDSVKKLNSILSNIFPDLEYIPQNQTQMEMMGRRTGGWWGNIEVIFQITASWTLTCTQRSKSKWNKAWSRNVSGQDCRGRCFQLEAHQQWPRWTNFRLDGCFIYMNVIK